MLVSDLVKFCDNFDPAFRSFHIRIYRDLDDYMVSSLPLCVVCYDQFVQYFFNDTVEFFRFIDSDTVEILICS